MHQSCLLERRYFLMGEPSLAYIERAATSVLEQNQRGTGVGPELPLASPTNIIK